MRASYQKYAMLFIFQEWFANNFFFLRSSVHPQLSVIPPLARDLNQFLDMPNIGGPLRFIGVA
jgi:hypothetical protein